MPAMNEAKAKAVAIDHKTKVKAKAHFSGLEATWPRDINITDNQ